MAKWLMGIAQLPIAIPNMILAVAAMFAWINEPFKLYGTGTIIIVTYAVLFTPICIKQMMGTAGNLDPAMDHAAQSNGDRADDPVYPAFYAADKKQPDCRLYYLFFSSR